MRSNYTLASLDEMNPDQLASLSAADLRSLNDELLEEATRIQRRADVLAAGIDARYSGKVTVERDLKSKDFGSVTVADGEYAITQTLTKSVVWDQAGLAALREAIRAQGDDPDVYMTKETKTVLKVAEVAYEKWPADVKAAFEPHRTVKVSGTPKWRIEVAK